MTTHDTAQATDDVVAAVTRWLKTMDDKSFVVMHDYAGSDPWKIKKVHFDDILARLDASEKENADLRARLTPTQSDWECASAIWHNDPPHREDGTTITDPNKRIEYIAKQIAAHVAPIRAQLDQAVADSNAWQTVACFLAGLMIPVGRFDVRRLFQWVRSGKDLATIPTGDARKGAGDES